MASLQQKEKGKEREQAKRLIRFLKKKYPNATCSLHYKNPFELLVATILSAQTTDVKVNKVTVKLFEEYPDAESLASASNQETQEIIKSIGLFRSKSKNIINTANILNDDYGGGVPRTMKELVKLPGVGRKTANVVLGNAFDIPSGIVVDTHVKRITKRYGLTEETDPEKVEKDLVLLVPKKDWIWFSHALILHGRETCMARKPLCIDCPIEETCPGAQK